MARKEFNTSKAAGKQKNYTATHYTPESAVVDLLRFVPIASDDTALDPSAGINKVWYNNFSCNKDYCEIDEGIDFFDYSKQVDWIIGNPPFTDFVRYLMHSPNIAEKGFAYLIGHSRINQITPKRLSLLEEKGFYLSGIQICTFKEWFGRYYFVIFSRNRNKDIGYSRKNYSHGLLPIN